MEIDNFAFHLLDALRTRGFEVRNEGDKLFVEPWKKLDPADFPAIKDAKAGLLALLAGETWKTCRKCKAEFDSTRPADVVALCDRQPCQLRSKK